MKRQPRPATDTPASGFTGAITLCVQKLTRYVSNLTHDELHWTPSGIRNSLSWILVHLTAELWCCHSAVTGKRLPFNPVTAGLAWGGVRGFECDKDKQLDPPPKEEPVKYLCEAWEALRSVMEGTNTDWKQREVYADGKMRTAWWFLIHSLCDVGYVSGQGFNIIWYLISFGHSLCLYYR